MLRFPFALAFAALGCAATAQRILAPAAENGTAPPSIDVDAMCGVNELDGVIVGGGPGYAVRCEPGAFRFAPLGNRWADGDPSVAFELLSIGRGDQLCYAASQPEPPSRRENTIRFQRGPQVVERYDVLPHGVEQSFEFAAPVPGSGDLVVRGRLITQLTLPPDADYSDGLVLRSPGGGAIHWGAVTVVDALGRTTPGQLRLEGDVLELRAPAAFADHATYPLVLDPMLWSNGFTFDPTESIYELDIAYDQSTTTYLVTWRSLGSPPNTHIRAQRVSADGALQGPMLTISALPSCFRPRVVNVNATNSFLVVWKRLNGALQEIRCATVPAASGGLPSTSVVVASAAAIDGMSAGGEWQSAGHQKALVVWDTGGDLRGSLVNVPGAGPPVPGAPFDLLEGNEFTSHSNPRLSRTGGSAGQWLLAYSFYNGFFPDFPYQIKGILVDRGGSLVGSTVGISASSASSTDSSSFMMDGDGLGFVTAWSDGAKLRVRAQQVTGGVLSQLSPSQEVSGEQLLGIAYGRAKTFLATFKDEEDATCSDHDTYGHLDLIGVDPSNCKTCESILSIQEGCSMGYILGMASTLSGGDVSSDRGLMAVSESAGPFFPAPCKGYLFEQLGSGGPIVDLGGGCTGGGSLSINGPVALGNKQCVAQLIGVDPAASIALLNVAFTDVPFPCGSCTGNASYGTLYLKGLMAGGASQVLYLPCSPSLLGLECWVQWSVLETLDVPCPLFPKMATSNKLKITVGQ